MLNKFEIGENELFKNREFWYSWCLYEGGRDIKEEIENVMKNRLWIIEEIILDKINRIFRNE